MFLLWAGMAWGINGAVLAELSCTSTYSLVKANPPQMFELFRVLYGSAAPPEVIERQSRENANFMQLSGTPAAKDLVFVHGMLKPMKRLNDKVFDDEASSGKEDVNAARNLFRMLFVENLEAHPELSRALVAQYTDFKTMELAFDPKRMREPQHFQAELDHVIRITQLHFSDLMVKYFSKNEPLLQKILQERGLTGDFRAWHLFGVSQGNPDLAVVAARQAASDFSPEHGVPLKARQYTDEGVLKPLNEIEAIIKPRLIAGIGATSTIFEKYEGTEHLVLSRDAIDILRKVSAADFQEYAAKVREGFEARFNRTLGDLQIRDLRDYFALADDFQPTVRIAKRTQIELKGATDGLLNVDFAAQNVENMHHTMGALAVAGAAAREGKPGAGTLAIEKAREGEVKATARLKELASTFDTARKNAGISGEYQSSGDDGSVVLRGAAGAEAREKFFRELLKGRPPASDYRVVFLPPMKGELGQVDTGGLSRESVKGENFEKALRSSLYGKVTNADLKKVGIAVELDPAAKTYRLTFFGPQAAVEAVQAKAQAQMAATSLAPEGYRLTSIQPIW